MSASGCASPGWDKPVRGDYITITLGSSGGVIHFRKMEKQHVLGRHVKVEGRDAILAALIAGRLLGDTFALNRGWWEQAQALALEGSHRCLLTEMSNRLLKPRWSADLGHVAVIDLDNPDGPIVILTDPNGSWRKHVGRLYPQISDPDKLNALIMAVRLLASGGATGVWRAFDWQFLADGRIPVYEVRR